MRQSYTFNRFTRKFEIRNPQMVGKYQLVYENKM